MSWRAILKSNALSRHFSNAGYSALLQYIEALIEHENGDSRQPPQLIST
jgi:hypothetical protein